MATHFREAYRFAEIILQIVGMGTVLKGTAWLYKLKQKKLENRVLATFRNNTDDGPWQSANGVVGEIYLKAALSDARGFLPPRFPLTGWSAFKHRLKRLPYRLRHALRIFWVLPSKKKADRILRDLWERGLLIRAGWDHTENEFYRVKN